ncbi:hypothetical protein VPH35_099646 [Triticum aestivum]|uniref:DUF295 domain-containing protein n=1 Tax=Aegilops tauschii TaxID=37682 RepID=R7VZB7_AEGTA
MEAAAATQPSTRAWSDLSPDLLLDISGRLHDAADFVRFHAVCTSWRHRLHSSATCPKFLPWPLSQCNDGQIVHSPAIYSRRVDVSSEVGGYDGNILTEPKAVTPLPPFPYDDDDRIRRDRMSNPHGVIYNDGTVILYTFIYKDRRTQFYKAAMLRPGEATWTVLQTRLTSTIQCSGAAYYNDKILLCASMAMEWANSELLRVSLLIERDWFRANNDNDPSPTLSVVVHSPEEGADGKVQWVARDRWSMSDRVLFLGSPTSFAGAPIQFQPIKCGLGVIRPLHRGHGYCNTSRPWPEDISGQNFAMLTEEVLKLRVIHNLRQVLHKETEERLR